MNQIGPRVRHAYRYVLPGAGAIELIAMARAETFDPDRFVAWADTFDLDDADDAIMRLAPLLHSGLRASGIEHPYGPRIAGIYRHTIYRNRVLMHRGRALVAALTRAGIDTMLLKGSAILSQPGFDIGTRPMADFDLLVPDTTSDARLLGLCQDVLNTCALEVLSTPRSLVVRTKEGFEIDFHRHLRSYTTYPNSTEPFWSQARVRVWEGTKVKVMRPEHIVFYTILHGFAYNQVSPVRWIVDVLSVLDRGLDFDAGVLTQIARTFGASEPVAVALDFLGHHSFLPKQVSGMLVDACADRWQDRAYLRRLAQPPDRNLARRLGFAALDYEKRQRNGTVPRGPKGFWQYILMRQRGLRNNANG